MAILDLITELGELRDQLGGIEDRVAAGSLKDLLLVCEVKVHPCQLRADVLLHKLHDLVVCEGLWADLFHRYLLESRQTVQMEDLFTYQVVNPGFGLL